VPLVKVLEACGIALLRSVEQLGVLEVIGILLPSLLPNGNVAVPNPTKTLPVPGIAALRPDKNRDYALSLQPSGRILLVASPDSKSLVSSMVLPANAPGTMDGNVPIMGSNVEVLRDASNKR
jgi:hypothetical protein